MQTRCGTAYPGVDAGFGYSVDLLGSQHKRAAFCCGVEPLDIYKVIEIGKCDRPTLSLISALLH